MFKFPFVTIILINKGMYTVAVTVDIGMWLFLSTVDLFSCTSLSPNLSQAVVFMWMG